MTDIGQIIFNKGKFTGSPTRIVNGLLVIYTFDSTTTPSTSDIDQCIYNTDKDNNNVLVFSPKGHLYFTSLDSNGNLANTFISKFSNPINPNESYSDNYTNWTAIDYTKFSLYNSSLAYPQFFSSLSANLGNIAIGSGYLLYRDKIWSNSYDNSKYYLLYNPFNRVQNDGSILINSKPALFSQYCNDVGFQDESCYCSNNKYNRCLYAFAGSQAAGDTILSIDKSTLSPSALQSVNGISANCACNDICQKWLGKNLLENQPNCSDSTVNVICGVNISAQDKSKIESPGGIKTEQICSANGEQGGNQGGNQGIIIISLLVFIIIAFFAFSIIFYKKMKQN